MDEKELQQLSEVAEALYSDNAEVLAPPSAETLMSLMRLGFRAGFINGYCYAKGQIQIMEATDEDGA